MPGPGKTQETPTHRLVRIGLWIFGGGVFATVLLMSSYMGLALSDTGWKSITSISLAVIASGVPLLVSYMKTQGEMKEQLNRVETHTNSLVQELVAKGRAEGRAEGKAEGHEEGRRREVERVERKEERQEEREERKEEREKERTDNAPPTITLEELEGKEVVIEGTLTEQDADKKRKDTE